MIGSTVLPYPNQEQDDILTQRAAHVPCTMESGMVSLVGYQVASLQDTHALLTLTAWCSHHSRAVMTIQMIV